MADGCQEKRELQVLFSTISWQKNKAYFIYTNAKVLYLSNYTLLLQHSFPPITKLNTKLSLRPIIKLPAWQGFNGEELKFPLPKSVLSWAYLPQPLSWSSLNSPSSPGLLGGSSRGLSTILLAKGQHRGASWERSSGRAELSWTTRFQIFRIIRNINTQEWLKLSKSSHRAPEKSLNKQFVTIYCLLSRIPSSPLSLQQASRAAYNLHFVYT